MIVRFTLFSHFQKGSWERDDAFFSRGLRGRPSLLQILSDSPMSNVCAVLVSAKFSERAGCTACCTVAPPSIDRDPSPYPPPSRRPLAQQLDNLLTG